MALDLLRGIKDGDHSPQLQLVKDTCATAFVGKSSWKESRVFTN